MQGKTAGQLSARNPVEGGIYIHLQGGGGISAEHRALGQEKKQHVKFDSSTNKGNEKFINKQGRINITRHQKVLSCLEKRALRYQKYRWTLEQIDEVLYQEALDETGTVPIGSLTESDNGSVTLR